MTDEKIITDVGVSSLAIGLVAWWHFAESIVGGLMLLGGFALLCFRFYLASKENKLLNIELEKAKRDNAS